MEGNKSKIIIGILAVLVLVMGAFIFCDKVLKDDKKTETKEEAKTCEKCPEVKKPKCTGNYAGSTSRTKNGFTVEYNYDYELKEDGTFTVDYGTTVSHGTYAINGNTISLTGIKELTGPADVDPHYSTQDFIIADDCSFILIDEPDGFKIYKK